MVFLICSYSPDGSVPLHDYFIKNKKTRFFALFSSLRYLDLYPKKYGQNLEFMQIFLLGHITHRAFFKTKARFGAWVKN
jgi:hypothetical protein